MYPFFRMAWQILKYRNQPMDDPLGVHVSHHICYPWDLDFAVELNNGRALSLYDLGRLPFAFRQGFHKTLPRMKWQMTMAGVVVRYRRRIRAFQAFEMHTRVVGYDDKFFYMDQSMWLRNGECASQAVYRVAIAGKHGIVPAEEVLRENFGYLPEITLPEWLQSWCDTEDKRPWPPEKLVDNQKPMQR